MCLLTAAHYFSLLKISTQHTLGYYYWAMLVGIQSVSCVLQQTKVSRISCVSDFKADLWIFILDGDHR